MFQFFMNKSEGYKTFPIDRRRAARRVGNEVLEEGLEVGYGTNGGYGSVGGFGTTLGNQPGMTVIVQWTPQFGMAFQQFLGGNMSSFPMARMGNMTGYPMGGMGNYGGMQGVPYRFS
ncbi:hypothetical protein I4U23_022770 [Adineta vaga]|nr:hypothetical protein I4U23_022770 [Adineta vaga]